MGKIKMEIKSGPSPLLGAYPTVIVGVNVDGRPDFTTVAWVGVAASVPPSITIALQHHRHSLKGIKQNMNFSVNIPSADLVNETDYCGLVSGARVDKAKDCGFKVFYGKLENVPFIDQCPINHSFEVVQILNLGSHELIVGRIVETFLSEECLVNGRPDLSKIKPILFAGFGYFGIGEHIGDAFKCGIAINPKEKMDTLEELAQQRKAGEKAAPNK
ncbi:MAG TPA: flavin reductase family protein [Dehalococcoidales bacterium]|jgi:flavin reductase (DIM6/NTAB) family NADH-FMN oxidoreductase RutF